MDTLRPAALVSVLTVIVTVAIASRGEYLAALIAYFVGCALCGILLFGFRSNWREIFGLPPKTR